MIPATFSYSRAVSVADAVSALAGEPEARLLAGGQSLIPLMKLRLARPSMLIDAGGVADLSYIREDDGHIAIGAMTRHDEVARSGLVRAHCGLLARATGEVGDPQVRHAGTIGGAIAHADPASDIATTLLALDGEVIAQGPSGRRVIASSEMFLGLFTTALAHDEVLVEVRVPRMEARGWSFVKFRRRALDWATVGVAVAAGPAAGASVALANMGDRPLRASAVEAALSAGADHVEAAALAASGTAPPGDPAASAAYRTELSKVLVRRALDEALRPR